MRKREKSTDTTYNKIRAYSDTESNQKIQVMEFHIGGNKKGGNLAQTWVKPS